jgi:hypothetical protein
MLKQIRELVKNYKAFSKAPDWQYLIHHMHPPKKTEDMETLHHCPLFEKENKKGVEYEQFHVKDGKKLLHAIVVEESDTIPKHVFDHLNNKFNILNKDKISIIKGPARMSDVVWSAEDKN